MPVLKLAGLNLLGFVGLGPTEMLVVAGVALLLFGNRLPGVMRSLGQGMFQFRDALSGNDGELEEKAQ